MRLGTRAREKAIMARARIFTLPINHPATRMLHFACNSSGVTWATHVKRLMNDASLPRLVPDITDHPCFTKDKLLRAAADPVFRKVILREYKSNVVRPILQQYDNFTFRRPRTLRYLASVFLFLFCTLDLSAFQWTCCSTT